MIRRHLCLLALREKRSLRFASIGSHHADFFRVKKLTNDYRSMLFVLSSKRHLPSLPRSPVNICVVLYQALDLSLWERRFTDHCSSAIRRFVAVHERWAFGEVVIAWAIPRPKKMICRWRSSTSLLGTLPSGLSRFAQRLNHSTAPSGGQSMDVSVDRKRRMTECLRHHHTGGLVADTGGNSRNSQSSVTSPPASRICSAIRRRFLPWSGQDHFTYEA